jgi:hypothetical protein
VPAKILHRAVRFQRVEAAATRRGQCQSSRGKGGERPVAVAPRQHVEDVLGGLAFIVGYVRGVFTPREAAASGRNTLHANRHALPLIEVQHGDFRKNLVAPLFPKQRLVGVLVERVGFAKRAEQIGVGMIGIEPVERTGYGGGLLEIIEGQRRIAGGRNAEV